MNTKVRTVALTAILAAVTLVLGLTPIGIITIPGFIEITIMCIPVIIGALTLGVKPGIALGALFAVCSIITAITRSPLGAILMDINITGTLITLIVPRVLVPVITCIVYRTLPAKKPNVKTAVASACGSLTNTVVFLIFMWVFFAGAVGAQLFTVAAAVNGTVECALAAAVCAPVAAAIRKSVRLPENKEIKA